MTNSTNRLPEFTFIDLFSGIGGFRQALEAVERDCVFSNEWDKYARNPYHQYGAEILIEQKGDITRRLAVQETQQLQGFDSEHYKFPVSLTPEYKQIGISVVIPAILATSQKNAVILNFGVKNG